jgi:hypothetical protein
MGQDRIRASPLVLVAHRRYVVFRGPQAEGLEPLFPPQGRYPFRLWSDEVPLKANERQFAVPSRFLLRLGLLDHLYQLQETGERQVEHLFIRPPVPALHTVDLRD